MFVVPELAIVTVSRFVYVCSLSRHTKTRSPGLNGPTGEPLEFDAAQVPVAKVARILSTLKAFLASHRSQLPSPESRNPPRMAKYA